MSDADTGALTPAEATELADLEGEMADTHSLHQPSNQLARDRVQALYERADGGAPVPVKSDSNAQRIGELEAMMREKGGEYWHSDKLQDEYRQLLQGNESGLPTEMVSNLADDLDVSELELSVVFELVN